MKKTFSTFRDPGSKPVCDKSACFEKHFSDLPESRLKLIVGQLVLKNDDKALKQMSQKLAEEEQAESKRLKKLSDNRMHMLLSQQNRKQQMDDLQAKSGLLRLNLRKARSVAANPRIESLAKPRPLKKGFAEDYIDSFGLLKAGVLQSGKSIMPRSSRIPGNKVASPFPMVKIVEKSVTWEKEGESKEEGLYSDREIRDCMRDINDFHQRIGRGRGKVGFPQIFLEEYKESN